MSAGNINTDIVIGDDTYNVEVNIPSDNKAPYLFKVADNKVNLIGLAIKGGETVNNVEQPDDVFLTVSPPPTILPDMIKNLNVSFYNGNYTPESNPIGEPDGNNTPVVNPTSDEEKLKLINGITDNIG
ncbi:hypothetical protein [Endozoicomonas arenosclerae]|uniref:hypothetical protein n=1 Tax=Endozoicomonas arenosclerae TaxID=1633495 RepID=UPI000782A3C2|nr:hypothetical protein [Endozoicomonas arenosclerae]